MISYRFSVSARNSSEVRQTALNLNDEIVNLMASIGISFHPDDTANTEILQRNADQAI